MARLPAWPLTSREVVLGIHPAAQQLVQSANTSQEGDICPLGGPNKQPVQLLDAALEPVISRLFVFDFVLRRDTNDIRNSQ